MRVVQVTKVYDKDSERPKSPDPHLLLCALQDFLSACRRPSALDYGEKPLVLAPGNHSLEIRSGRVMLEVWDETRSLSRRILSIERRKPGVLDCKIQRFGGSTGPLTLLDLDRPQTAARAVRGVRQSFAEQFRRMLQRQFPAWHIRSLSSALDLRRSFSASFPRAHIVHGSEQAAALACPTPDQEPAFLSSALLWCEYLRHRASAANRFSLCLFLPEGAGAMTAHRLRWLTGRPVDMRVYLFNEHGVAGEVDPQDLGNLATRLNSHYVPARHPAEVTSLFNRLVLIPGVTCLPELAGATSVRYRGLEFARVEADGAISLGIEARDSISLGDIHRVEQFAHHLAGLETHNRWHQSVLATFPEKWFESSIRTHLERLDPELLPEPVHSQVLSFAGGERELIDLLAISRSRRLTILELKTSEDIHLPLQALDYWIRIRWHAERDELSSLFPGAPVAQAAPKLLLVAPALTFHPTNEIVLRYFSPEIEVERIGVNSDWESDLQVIFRLAGSDLPISHRGADDTRRAAQY
jgi:hypothetical protein